MNSLSITLKPVDAGDGTCYKSIQLSMDGSRLQDMAREYELPFAKREGHPDIAGGYIGLDASKTDARRFLGEIDRDYGEESDKTALMECTCGCPGCWPLVARITSSESSITWSGFEQPHRGPEAAAGHWDYSGFGPFQFDREQYVSELARIKNAAQQVGAQNP